MPGWQTISSTWPMIISRMSWVPAMLVWAEHLTLHEK